MIQDKKRRRKAAHDSRQKEEEGKLLTRSLDNVTTLDDLAKYTIPMTCSVSL